MKQLVQFESQNKLLNSSLLRQVYEILLKHQLYDLLKQMVGRILSKKKTQSSTKLVPNNLSYIGLQFYQAMNIHWSICFDEELFHSTLLCNRDLIAKKNSRLRHLFYNLTENGLANKLRLAIQTFEFLDLQQIVLEKLMIVQMYGFTQMYFRHNESWLKFYQ